jgi:putative DNA primase/helicase
LGDERVTNTFATLSHPKAGKPVTNYIYRNQDGEPVLIANRFNKPDGGKFFVPFDVTRSEWKAPETRPLYNLDKIMQAHPAEPVILVEGEKCADALTALGYLATTTYGGCNALRKADLSPLRRRTVMLWPDLDPPGLSYVGKAALTLHRDFEAVPKVVPITETLLCNVML